MAVAGKSVIMDLVKRYKIVHPFDPKLLDGDSYILTVGETITIQYLSHRNVISREIVFIPLNYIGWLSTKSRFGRLGLFFSGSVKVHSGFCGRLALEFVNINDDHEPITIKAGEPLIHLDLLRREGEPSPYGGEYQFQYMTKDEVKLFLPYMRRAWLDAGLEWNEKRILGGGGKRN